MVKKEDAKVSTVHKHSSPHKEFYTKLAVIGVIVIVVIGVFLFAGLRTAGKASAFVINDGYGYNPDVETIVGDGTDTGIVYAEKVPVESSEKDCAENNSGYCFSKTADVNDCFAPNSVLRFKNNDKLCEALDSGDVNDGTHWISCTGNNMGNIFDENEKFYCGGDNKFYPCVAENNKKVYSNDAKKYLCVASKNKWKTCSDKLVETDKLQLDNEFLCINSTWKWQECSSVEATSDKKYYCEKDEDKWKWKECTKNELSADNKAYCQQKGISAVWKWKNCTSAGLTIGNYYCKSKGGVWTTVGTTDLIVDGVKETCNSTNIGTHDKNLSQYCNGKGWESCNVFNKYNLSSDTKAYCGTDSPKWNLCNPTTNAKEIWPTSNVPNQYQFLCDDTQQKWITCDSNLNSKLMFPNLPNFVDLFYCGKKDEKWQWQNCSSNGLITGDNTKICKFGKYGKWVSPPIKLGPDDKLKQFFGTSSAGMWIVCNSGNESKVIIETSTKYWQCNAGATTPLWKEKNCTKSVSESNSKTITDSINKQSYICEKIGQNSYQWSSFEISSEIVKIDQTTNYEVKFNKSISIKSVNDKLYQVTLCDTDTEKDPSSATVCYKEQSKDSILSKVLKKGTPQQIKQDDSNLYFLYYGEVNGVKVASVILKVNLTAVLSLSEGNLYWGENVLIELNGENYLLSYTQPSGSAVVSNTSGAFETPISSTFDMNKLNLNLLKNNGKTYTGTMLPSANCKVYENLELNKDMTFCLEGGALKLYPKALDSSYQAEPTKVKLNETYENYISATQSLNILAPSDNDFSKVYLCDTESLGYKADVCFNKVKQGIISLKYLKGQQQGTPYIKQGVAFLYETEVSASDAKQVKAILTKSIPGGITLEKNAFSENLRSGRRLVLKLYSQYYLLSHPIEESFFDDKLVLQHLPDLTNYPNSGLVYLTSKGVQGVQFEPYAGEVITIYPDGNNYKISSKLSKEIATTTALPQDIKNAYEVPFTKDAPALLLIDGPNPIVSVCSKDSNLDAQKMLVCLFNKPEITLTKNTLRNETINDIEFTLLYQLNGTKKQGLVLLTQLLSSISSDLDYNDFMNNLAGAGRHLALKFGSNLYLLQHSYPAELFGMTNLSLAYYEAQSKIEIPAVGNDKKVTFSLPDGGRISLERDPYEETPPPFQIYAQTKQDIADIPFNLTEVLYIPFSSAGSVKIVEPNFGIISVDPSDNAQDAGYFKLSSNNSDKFILYPKTSFVKNGALFYYDNSYKSGNDFIKTAQIYKFYNLSKQEYNHSYTNEFIQLFTGGNNLVLFFNHTYYLLGYKGAAEMEQGPFDRSKMYLRNLLDSSEEYSPGVVGLTATFKTSGGDIIIATDIDKNLLNFSTKTKETLSMETFAEDAYIHTLTTTNKVVIGNTTISMCSLNLYSAIPKSAGICFNQNKSAVPVKNHKTFTIEGKPYLLEVNDQTGTKKEVVIHQIIPLTSFNWTVNWETFSQKLTDGDTPIFDIGGTLYLPGTPDNKLESLFFIDYENAKGNMNYAENIQEIGETAILFNGTFVLKDRLLFADQIMNGEERDLTLTLRDYYIIPYTGAMELNSSKKSVQFVTKVDGKKYNLTSDFGTNLVWLSLNSTAGTLIAKYYKLGDNKYITLDGEQIKIDITTKEKIPGDKKTKIPIVLISRS
jgi:hypothetical protein